MKTATFVAIIALSTTAALAQGVGYTDTPQIRGQKWKVHDKARPNPPEVIPGATFSHGAPAPSDATILFDGRDFSAWQKDGGGAVPWKIVNGYMEVVGKSGGIHTKQEFGDAQLHIEFATPIEVKGDSQGRGNSGVFFHRFFEIQVLDSHNNKTYADGQAGALYGQWPPLVNAIKSPGQWNSYDIVFRAARFKDGQLTEKAMVSMYFNGQKVHKNVSINQVWGGANSGVDGGNDKGKGITDSPQGLKLQCEGHDVRYRNAWIKELELKDASTDF
jgi:hypothetical protein